MENTPKQALILAAGIPCMNTWYGWPIDSKPKCLVHVNGQVILERNVKMFKKYGIENIFIVVNYQKDQIIQFNKEHDLNLNFIDSPNLESGIGAFDSFQVGLEKMQNKTFILVEGDVTCSEDLFINIINDKNKFTLTSGGQELRIAKIDKSQLPSNFDILKKEIYKTKFPHHPFEIGFYLYLHSKFKATILEYADGHVIEIDFYAHCDEGSQNKLIREYIKEIL